MATQKEMRMVRQEVIGLVESTNFAGFELVGVVSEGVLFQHEGTGAFVVLKPIVKKEEFDAEDAMAEFAEKEAAREEKAKEKARKEEERAKKKAEKEAE